MASILTRHSNTPSKDIQDKRIRNKEHRQAAQECTRPAHAEVMKHGSSEQRKACSKRGSHEVISCQGGGCVFRIRVRQVGKDAVENEAAADGKEHGGYDGDNPVDGGEVACPAKPEQGDGECKCADTGRRKLVFWFDVPVFVKVFGLVLPLPVEVGRDRNAAGRYQNS